MQEIKECDAEHEDKFGKVGCTRPLGHSGVHIATCEGDWLVSSEDVTLIWDDEQVYDDKIYSWRPLVQEDGNLMEE